jgi:beta-lactamase superfamily II metal-dependent hydrolase
VKRVSAAAIAAFALLAALALFLYFYGGNPPSQSPPPGGGALEVVFIDVGQAESILLKHNGRYALIDAGESKTAKALTGFLKNEGVERLDFVIATHPHSDHIGGMEAVIRAFDIDVFIMPDIENDTKTFENMVDALLEKDVRVAIPVPGDVYTLGEAELTILFNQITPKSLNNCSVVSRLTFGALSVLFTGDMESEVEAALLLTGRPVRSDFLNVAHHGSSTSSTQEFLSAVAPGAAFISCGVSNSYNHPHVNTITKLTGMGAAIYRTDEDGTVRLILSPDGKYDVEVSGK